LLYETVFHKQLADNEDSVCPIAFCGVCGRSVFVLALTVIVVSKNCPHLTVNYQQNNRTNVVICGYSCYNAAYDLVFCANAQMVKWTKPS